MRILRTRRPRAVVYFISVNILASVFFLWSASFPGQSEVVKASTQGNIDEVRRLLASKTIGPDELVDALGMAANRGHIEIAKLLLDSGANPNQACLGRSGPLILAVTKVTAVKLLLDHGAIPTPQVWESAISGRYFDSAELVLDRWVETPEGVNDVAARLIRCAIKGDIKQVRQVLKSDAVDKISETDWNMAFRAAVNRGHAEIVEEMIAFGSQPDATRFEAFQDGSFHGETFLSDAIDSGHADVVRVLLHSGIDLEKMREDETCPLTSACRKGRIDIVKLLLDKGAPANDGSALVAAAGGSYLPGHGGGHLDVVKLLVEKGADVNALSGDCLDPTGDFLLTALQVAAREGHLDLVRYLLEKGADPKIEMIVDGVTCGDNAVTLAAWKGHTSIVKLFLEKGADINKPASTGMTPLMAAASGDRLETVEYLLARGANINAAEEHGNTPLFYALRKHNPALVKLLLERGADPNLKNGKGFTVLDIAERHNLKEIAELLEAARSKQEPK